MEQLPSELLEACEHALLLLQYPRRNTAGAALDLSERLTGLLKRLVVDSDYAGILVEFRQSFQFSLKTGLSINWSSDSNAASSALELLICGIAALQAFLQTNWTGPVVELSPKDLFINAAKDQSADGSNSTQQEQASTSANPEWSEESVNARCVDDLSLAGEPAYHLTQKSGFLLLAIKIFSDPTLQSSIPSIPVWQLRAGLANLRLLDTPVYLSSPLLEKVQSYTDKLDEETSSTIRDTKTSLTLLQGIYHAQFVHVSSTATRVSNDYFYQAARLANLQYELTGRMGKRTKFQIDEKSQLVVLARSRDSRGDGLDGWKAREKMSLETAPSATNTNGVQANGQDGSDAPKALLLNDDTLLERTHFTSSAAYTDDAAPEAKKESALTALDPNHQPALHPQDECILLAMSLMITNTSPAHGLTTTQIQAFVARVLEDGSQNWSIYSMALLLRSRLEANRSRTVERGLLQIQSLVDQLKLESVAIPKKSEKELDLEKGADPRERLAHFYELSLPSTWELEKELAQRYLGLGVVVSAREIFTRLEMWEEVARCYASIEQEDKAIKIVKDLLAGKILESEATMSTRRQQNQHDEKGISGQGPSLSKGQKAKLWCLLGDLESNIEHYETAWQVSEHTSARAMQSLGKAYFVRKDYKRAQEYLSKSLAINPLNGKLWFILGCSAMRNEEWKIAENAFRRCTSIDDDDGESWNNLATVILRQASNPETLAAATNETVKIPKQAMSNGLHDELEEDTAALAASQDPKEQAYNLKRLAFTCLRQAIKHAYDSWRIWGNYLLVSVDVGELSESCRAMTRLAQLRAEKDGTNAIDLDVLDKLVQVVVRDAASAKIGEETLAVDAEDIDQQRGLAGRVKALFEQTLLPRITDSSHIYTSYARLLFALGDIPGSIQAHLKAYRVDVVQNEDVSISKPDFEKAAERVTECVDVLKNLGDRTTSEGEIILPNWRSQARSMIRTFLGRTKEGFGEEQKWVELQEELAQLKL